MEWLLAVMCVGFAFEFGGLVLAARGLFQTWTAHANGRPFFPASVRQAARWVRSFVLGRPPHAATVVFGGSARTRSGMGHAFVSTGFNDGMTLEQKVDAAQANALQALKDASRAHAAVTTETRKREQALAGLTSQVERVDAKVTEFARGLVVDGIPVAVTGLALAAFGLLLQGVAAVATFPEIVTSR